jgi:hypothetical protein
MLAYGTKVSETGVQVNLNTCVFDQHMIWLIQSQTFILFLYVCPP